MIKASTLGHSGIGEPATSTSGRITNRINCPIAIRPNMMLATRNPVICDLIVFSLDVGLIGLMGQSQSHKSYKSHKQTGKCHSSDFFFEKCLIAIGESGCGHSPFAHACRTARRAGLEGRRAIGSLRPRRGSAGTAGLALGPVAHSIIGPVAGPHPTGT